MRDIDNNDSNNSLGPNSGFADGVRRINCVDDDVTAVVVRKKSVSGAAGYQVQTVDQRSKLLSEDYGTETAQARASRTEEEDTLAPGFVLRDRFEIVTLVHSGGMGHVYKALDRRRHPDASEQVHVAIKMMRRASLEVQPNAHLTLEREAARTQRLSHPNIVNIYDFDQHENQFYLVMEWLEGESVNALLKRTNGRPLATQFALRLVRDVAAGLQHAHANNVVHADVNPSNVFITDTQEIKLLDFGVARNTVGREDENSDCDELVWATRAYASPEVLSGLSPTAADDIFSLACVAYRALSGVHAFGQYSALEAMQAALIIKPVSGLAAPYWQTLQSALSYNRASRPASAAGFLADVANDMVTRNEVIRERTGGWRKAATIAFGGIVLAGVISWVWQESTLRNAADVRAGLIQDNSTAAVAARSENSVVAEPSAVDLLLQRAGQAMVNEHFIEPEGDNARELFREVLAQDADNPAAQSALRDISDFYLQIAEGAWKDDDPAAATAAVATAAETDPANPGIVLSREWLLTRANEELIEARLAIADGNIREGERLLAKAQSYALIDSRSIDSVSDLLEQGAREQYIVDRLTSATTAIAAGRLSMPAEDNAQAILIELQHTHGTDSRILAAMERLGERLISRAEFATAAYQFPGAIAALDAAEALGVLAAEVAAAQALLQLAMQSSEEAALANINTGDADSAARVQDGATLPDADTLDFTVPGSNSSERAVLMASTNTESNLVLPEIMESAAPPVSQLPGRQILKFSDLVIRKYVPPKFSNRATEDELQGAVDLSFTVNEDGSTSEIKVLRSEPGSVFVSSASNAVRQWRFERRDDAVKTQVRLRFDWENER